LAFEHEIPKGGKLYFGQSAALKRDIENKAVETLVKEGFEEIVTPFFSYQKYQTTAFTDAKNIIRLADSNNSSLTLRADSSLDVVRIITKRLGRSTDHKKWFYVQPVFHFPSTEVNQIGAEYLDSIDMAYAANLSIEIFNKIGLKPVLQLSNVAIAKAAATELKIDLDAFKKSDYFKLKSLGKEWLNVLLDMERPDELETATKVAPASIKIELEKMSEMCQKIKYENIVLAPLYVSKANYYTDSFFRMLIGNDVLARGGNYAANNKHSCGFAIYTDNIIKRLSV
jgi:ATP phosphoribosyltransferase regulatory subunit HisZ